MDEAINIAFKITRDYAVMIAENEYPSDKEFEGVMIYVKK